MHAKLYRIAKEMNYYFYLVLSYILFYDSH